MNTLSSDTHPDVERFHIELIRKASVFQRLEMVSSLVKTTRRLSWQGISERYSNETLESHIERFLFLLYNDSIMAKRVPTLIVNKKSRYKMKTPDIIEVTLKVVNVLEKLGIPCYLGGSLASSAFGIPRATLDADLVANIKSEQVASMEELLKSEFYIDTEMINNAILHKSSFNLIHFATLFKIDVFIPKDRPFSRQVFIHRIQKAVSEDASQKIFFAAPEDIILYKLEWYKAGGKVSDRQWNDVLGILKVQGAHLDMPYLNKWARELSVLALLKKALDEAGIS